ncbi:hypothetical protein ABQF26_20455, partial [Mycolicibacterium elephantis]
HENGRRGRSGFITCWSHVLLHTRQLKFLGPFDGRGAVERARRRSEDIAAPSVAIASIAGEWLCVRQNRKWMELQYELH